MISFQVCGLRHTGDAATTGPIFQVKGPMYDDCIREIVSQASLFPGEYIAIQQGHKESVAAVVFTLHDDGSFTMGITGEIVKRTNIATWPPRSM